MASLATQATLLFGRRRGLVTTRAGSRDARAAWIRGVLNAAVIILSIGLAWVNTAVAKFSWLLLAAVPPAAQAIVRRLDRGERTRPGAPPGELP